MEYTRDRTTGQLNRFVLGIAVLAVLMLGVIVLARTSLSEASAYTGGHNGNGTTKSTGTIHEEAWSHEPVFVLVELDVPFKPEGYLESEIAVRAQRKGIRKAQEAFLTELEYIGTDHRVTARYETIPSIALQLSRESLAILDRSRLVVSYTEEQKHYPTLDNNPAGPASDSTTIVQADLAQSAGFDGSGFAIAILDTGVDSTHPFLRRKVVAEACYTAGNCPNGGDVQLGAGAAAPCPQSGCDHGTHVAGIAAGNNKATSPLPGDPSVGVSSGADIIAVQIFSVEEISGELFAWPHDWLLGLVLVHQLSGTVEFNVASVNMSLGGARFFSSGACDIMNPSVKNAIDNLKSVGVATVASSGNESYKDSMAVPACVSSAVSVGNVDKSDNVLGYSNSADFLDLLAPGQVIFSSVPMTVTSPASGIFGTKSGTSMAAPHVAGAFAILKQAFPTATVDDLLKLLKNAGNCVTDQQNWVTTPRIQISDALNFLGSGCVPAVMPTTCNGLPVTIFGANTTVGTIYGTTGDDVIMGTGGDDVIEGGDGDDTICGGPGMDTIRGQDGNDTLLGQQGTDHIWGGDGVDVLKGQSGVDYLYGGPGTDNLAGGAHNDFLWGGKNDDTLRGGDGWDTLHGEGGDDELYGEVGVDTLFGGIGDDELRGGDGPDFLYGQWGNDKLWGMDGGDFLNGGPGNDFFRSGAGNDLLIGEFGNDDFDSCGPGWDSVDGGPGTDTVASNCEVVIGVP